MMWYLVFAATVAVCLGQRQPPPPPPAPAPTADLPNVRNRTKPAFRCYDGTFLQEDQVCDGVDDCSNSWRPFAEDEEPRRCAGPEKYVCNDWNQTVIDIDQKCDGHNDCPIEYFMYYGADDVADDELAYTCAKPDEFPCDARVIIHKNQTCDGVNDCPASPWGRGKTADEDAWMCVKPGQVVCSDGETIIDETQKCDKSDDCPVMPWDRVAWDENPYECKQPDEFICRDYNMTIIKLRQKCDDNEDCPKNEWEPISYDESAYTCAGPDDFICWSGVDYIPNDKLCDGTPDCKLQPGDEIASDENEYVCAEDDEIVCGPTHAISDTKGCDGVNDCAGIDEIAIVCEMVKNGTWHNWTPHMHYDYGSASGSGSGYESESEDDGLMCYDGTWVSAEQMCDGVNDCAGADESWCPDDHAHLYRKDIQRHMGKQIMMARRKV